jgi:hypothetical protein
MQVGQIILVQTDPATQFTATLAQNATLGVDIPPVPATGVAANPPVGYVDQGLGGTSVACRIRGITVVSVDNLDWEVDVFSAAVATAIASASFLGGWRFIAADGKQFAGAGSFYYYKGGLDIPYFDAAGAGKIHLVLCNRSASGKTTGAIQIILHAEPSYGR